MIKKYPAQIKIFGERIKELRLSHSMTQEELGAKTGISGRSIQRIEVGDVAIGLNVIFALAQTFDIEASELLVNITATNKKKKTK